MAAFDACQLGYVFGDEPGSDGVDLLSGFEPVAYFEAFVVELAAGDVEVEADDGAPVVGLLADDVRECGGLAPLFPVASFVPMAHTFYCEGVGGDCQGAVFTAEGAESAEGEVLGGHFIRRLPGVEFQHFTARDVVSRWDVSEVYTRAKSRLTELEIASKAIEA